MLLIIHITTALASLAISTYNYFHPTKRKLQLTYLSTVFTLISGISLVILTPTHLVSTCISGFIYLGYVIYLSTKTRLQLSHQEI